ncbi:HK97-gp10 family putative phage morphogenesis protein [Caulobacter sp. FWC2]|uniref:HK97-gp10 family putative phage morphogenesis protein n=1 Tax=Caulobacter sp. FWC2 TaxID=69664 RepID=UPI000C156187|nr:HK97-gp10 family putative phage morphogenesis protein [Caulobacter sp. FWC2]PIB90998.1 hypothetical protein CSW62_05080 [Caulobacter sp. FWC2]
MKGADVFKRRLGSIRRAVENAPELFQEAGEEWLEQDAIPAAQQLAPVRTGELRDSIGGAANEQQVRLFATAEHARAVEEGTSKMAAQPYLAPAIAKTRNKLSARIRTKLKDHLK